MDHKHTTGEVHSAGFLICSNVGDGEHLAATHGIGVGTGLRFDECRANAARLAAGWNLLETLEGIEALALLEAVRLSLNCDVISRDKLDMVARAIRTALESKP